MAGLRHNPDAANCVKNDGAAKEGEVCDYCARNQPAGPNLVETEATVTPLPKPPLVGAFLERVGIQKGGHLIDVRMVDGEILAGPHEIVDIAGLSDSETYTLDVVIAVREAGVSRGRTYVRWAHVVSYTTA